MLWTRSELKQNAKNVLKKTYLMAFVISFVLYLVGSASSGGSRSSQGGSDDNSGRSSYPYQISTNDLIQTDQLPFYVSVDTNEFLTSQGYANPVFSAVLSSFLHLPFFMFLLVVLAISFLFKFLIGYLVEIGGQRYFLDTAEGRESGFYRLGYGFHRDFFKNISITMFFRDLSIFLFSLLLIVPGIVKSYEYRMVPYLLADNPRLNPRRALALSRDMTMGHKWNIFLLELSFFGYYIIGYLFFEMGKIFVWPYENATMAQLYVKLRENALDHGMASYEDLGVRRDDTNYMI